MKKPIVSLKDTWRSYYMAYMYHNAYSTSGKTGLSSTVTTYTQYEVEVEKKKFTDKLYSCFTKENYATAAAKEDVVHTYDKFLNALNIHELEHLKGLFIMEDAQPLFLNSFRKRESSLLHHKLDKTLEVNPIVKKSVKI